MMSKRPFQDSKIRFFLEKRILELKPIKSQAKIASEAGFRNASMLALIKNGATRLPFDRIPALATALDVNPRWLLLLAIDQSDDTSMQAFSDIVGTVITQNEIAWIEEIRSASGNTNPSVTSRSRAAVRSIFGK